MHLSLRSLVHGTAATFLLGGVPQAWAQGLDNAKVVIGFAPGGTIDITGRRVADKLAPVSWSGLVKTVGYTPEG